MTLADPIRLSRRDRAALTLALECCRSESRSVGERPRRRGISRHDAAEYALANVRVVLDCGARTHHVLDAIIDADEDHPRTLRARLALLLRAALRADAGDFGPVGCDACGNGRHLYDEAFCGWCGACRPYETRVRPLWESAPPARPR